MVGREIEMKDKITLFEFLREESDGWQTYSDYMITTSYPKDEKHEDFSISYHNKGETELTIDEIMTWKGLHLEEIESRIWSKFGFKKTPEPGHGVGFAIYDDVYEALGCYIGEVHREPKKQEGGALFGHTLVKDGAYG